MNTHSFHFVGRLSSSKSLMIRALMSQSYKPELKVLGESLCEDVTHLKQGLVDWQHGKAIDCGDAAAVLRFIALRVSRLPGKHVLFGSPRLMSRPHDELSKILRQLNVEAQFKDNHLEITSSGWRPAGDTLLIHSEQSSQFASAVLLNAWQLPFSLYVSLPRKIVSQGYWQMTNHLVEHLGMQIDRWDQDLRIPQQQTISKSEFMVEADMSNAFAIAAIAAVAGTAILRQLPRESWQPDAYFTQILHTMGVPLVWQNDQLQIHQAMTLQPISVSLTSCPDLFPVLAALCSLAEGESLLYGAPQLAHKESNRIANTVNLLQLIGRRVEALPDGVRIFGPVPKPNPSRPLRFDPDHDHRLAMAAAVLHAAGFPLHILNPDVVKKSFPEFWSIVSSVVTPSHSQTAENLQ